MKVLLLGLGRANINVAKYLLTRGDEVYLYEENLLGLKKTAKALLKEGRIKEFVEMDYDLVVTSPGFSESKPIIKLLRGRGLEIIDETEFTYQNLKEPKIIAVTGTNGKSTTVGLISNILNCARIKNFLGGNIAPGQPFSSALFQRPYEYYVLEMSSFQLARIKSFHPIIAVFTNISVDHLDWHQGMEEYIGAKKRIFMNQNNKDYAVINYDDEIVRRLADGINSQVVYFGTNSKNGAWLNDRLNFIEEEIIPVSEVPLFGLHNQFNVLAAIAVAKILKIPNEDIKNGIKGFKSLPHRLEDLGFIEGIRYINNSMSTNEAAAIASFKAVLGNKIVIIGGRAKGSLCEDYLALLIKEAKGVVILGENAALIAEFFKQHNYKGYSIANDMDDAIKKAQATATSGDIIILNPAFASFGTFRNFQERGEAFKDAVYKHR